MRWSGFLVAAVSVAVLTSCSRLGGEGVACTLVGDVPGVTVEVAAEVAPIRGLVLTTCVGSGCTDHAVALTAGQVAASPTCDGTGEDAVCSSGELTLDGTQLGHLRANLPEGPLEVSGSYRSGTRTVTLAPVTVPVTRNYPNGRQCEPGGTGARLVLDPSGLVSR